MKSPTSIVEASGLSKTYGSGNTEVVALRNVSISIERGQVSALLGPSGAGKSTLLTILGLIRHPDAGRIVIDGTIVFDGHLRVDAPAFRRNHIGFVFQKANLIPFLSALENVQLAMEINDVSSSRARARATSLLEELGLKDRLHSLPAKLSGGQQQRVAIARALANTPGLILADEPTAALDSARGRQVMELFRSVARRHSTGVVVVTHDHRALDVFDHAWEMEDGNLQKSEIPKSQIMPAIPTEGQPNASY